MNYFIIDERDLSPAYLASCRKFFKAGREDAEMYKRQATSFKLQAPSATKRTQKKDKIKI